MPDHHDYNYGSMPDHHDYDYGSMPDHHESIPDNHGSIPDFHGPVPDHHGSINGNHGSFPDLHGPVQGNHGSIQGNHGSMQGNHGSMQGNYGSMQGDQSAGSSGTNSKHGICLSGEKRCVQYLAGGRRPYGEILCGQACVDWALNYWPGRTKEVFGHEMEGIHGCQKGFRDRECKPTFYDLL